jgi:2-polyprenyl-3-methyl-5-hydroxy-6-metoxy-1,4-benzoquinol methylase
MQKTFFLKKKCFLCNKITLCSIESKLIKSKIKCNVYKCQKCTLQFLDKKFVNKNIKKNFYEENYFHSYDDNYYINPNNIYKKIFNEIKSHLKNKEVLEVGPGGGYFYNYLKNYIKDYEAIEIGSKQRSFLKDKYDLKVFDSFSKVKKKYDVVILISVLEHVKNPISFLKKISSFLKKNGKIIIEVPNVNDPLVSLYNLDYYKEKYYRKVHLNYFNSSTIKSIVNKLGFKILQQKTILTYSLTNHLNWFYKKKGNKNSYDATNIYFDKNINSKLLDIFVDMDKIYKKKLENNGYGDIEICVCKK